jgi:hypothetical protein
VATSSVSNAAVEAEALEVEVAAVMLLMKIPLGLKRILMAACDGLGAGFFKGCWLHLSMH